MIKGSAPVIEAYWQNFIHSLPGGVHKAPETYQAWGFGDNPEMADTLGRLVSVGVKTATASLVWAYETGDEPFPKTGDYSVILDGQGEPLCIIQTTHLDVRPFNDVDDNHAYLEGEGDRSLAFWREVHWEFFSRECVEIGREPTEQMPVLCERFKLVYP
jgi:uncharacterized protein YhfF